MVTPEPEKSTLRTLILSKIDEFFFWFRHNVPPKVIAVILAIILIPIGLLAYNWTDTWPEWFGSFGFFVTSFGFCYTIYQLYETKITAQLRNEEYKRASDEFAKLSRQETEKLYRYCLEQAKILLAQMMEHENNRHWQLLSVRIGDLVDLLLRVAAFTPQADERWRQHADKLNTYRQVFSKATAKTFEDYNPADWNQVVYNVRISLAQELGTSLTNMG